MPDDITILRDTQFADQINKMQELISQSARAFLFGAGASVCAGLPLIAELTTDVINDPALSLDTKEILEQVQNDFIGCPFANIEDYMSEIVDIVAIGDRWKDRGVEKTTVAFDGKIFEAQALKQSLKEIKQAIAGVLDKKKIGIDTHRKFIKAIHQTLRAGKGVVSRPVDYFVLNYDTLIEDALALERLPYTDGFCGGATAWWHEASFEAEGNKARVIKLHGSIDWCRLDGDAVPRRIRKNLSIDLNEDEKVMIWPAATKYVETQRDPYAQMLEILRTTLRRDADVVLTVCGYRFADKHINIEIDRALRESGKRLTIIVLTELDEPQEKLKDWLSDSSVREQIRIYSKRGFFHATTAIKATNDLPWWKFEVLTRLLGGER